MHPESEASGRRHVKHARLSSPRALVGRFDPIIKRVLRNEEMERLQMTRGVILSILKV